MFFLCSFCVIEPKPDQPKLDLFFKIPSFPKSDFSTMPCVQDIIPSACFFYRVAFVAVHCSFIAVLSLFSSNFRLNYSVRMRVEQVRKSYHFLPILKFRPRAHGTSFYSSSTVLAVFSQFLPQTAITQANRRRAK